MSAILKSLASAILGASLFFSFFMLLSGPVLIIAARLQHQDSAYVAPIPLFRMAGLPLSAVVFILCFVLAMKKFRRTGISSSIRDTGSNAVLEAHGGACPERSRGSRADQPRKNGGL